MGKKIPLHNNGTPIRNWLHAEDTASAVLQIIDAGVQNEIYNIAGGFEQANLDTVKKLLCVLTKSNDYDINNYVDMSCSRVGQDLRYSLDDSKLRAIGWEPQKKFDDELEDIVNYYKNKFIW